MKSHLKLTISQRYKIETRINDPEYLVCDIANDLGVHRSTISNELRKNSFPDGRYDAKHAQKLSEQRYRAGRRKVKKLTKYPEVLELVENFLQEKLSPEQICGTYKTEVKGLCHETIYQFIYSERMDLKVRLRQKKGKFRRKRGTQKRNEDRENLKKKNISLRSKLIEKRKRLGDFEGDTVQGEKGTGSILTIVDRKSGFAFGVKLACEEKDIIRDALISTLSRVSEDKRKTITLDNGRGFWDFELVDKALGTTTYFANPYHSWERGCNENFNGLLREYFPKKTSFGNITQKDVDLAIEQLNHRPRKRLGYLTPYEVFVLGKKPKKRV
jgi:IS30 family transposase